ncbi:A/G-specific adenine glycosylase [bacterium]|nr:A/G-specific adenine glycosylase [candidate division CSSED10-310 bacterium]
MFPDAELIAGLMHWFDTHRRTMPWRGESDPYRIWVSEVMLQQTQVATVESFYRRWMELFPTLDSLAAAPIDTVLTAWEGLGYYSRARNLLAGAQTIRDRFNGQFPVNRADALTIPGVGDYIAGAVISIAYNLPEPAVDGNVIRVITRLAAIPGDPGRISLRRKIQEILRTCYGPFAPRWVNQAWMEFGALQCIPHPDCSQCPFHQRCTAFQTHHVDSFPEKSPRKPIPHRSGTTFIIRSQNTLLLVRRPDHGLLNGLWEPPNCMHHDHSPKEFMEMHGIHPNGNTLGTVTHTYSHFTVTFHVQPAVLTRSWTSPFWVDFRWITPDTIPSFARPRVHIKAMTLAGF